MAVDELAAMKTVLVYIAFGIPLSLANVREIVEGTSSDSSGSYGEFGGGNGFEYGENYRKTEERFHTFIEPLGNTVSRATGGVVESGVGLRPRISDHGKIVYTKSDYVNYGSYDSSTVTYSNENSGNNGGFDRSGNLDVRSSGLEQSKGVVSSIGRTGVNRGKGTEAISGIGIPVKLNMGYKGLDEYRRENSALRGLGSQDYYVGLKGSGRFTGFGLGNNIFGGLGNLFGLGGLGTGFGGLNLPKPPINLPRPPGIGLFNQKLDDAHGDSDGIVNGGNGDGSGSEINHNECGKRPCGGHSGTYAFASASTGTYSK